MKSFGLSTLLFSNRVGYPDIIWKGVWIIPNGIDVKILHKETNRFKRAFSEMVYIKKESENSHNEITDIEHLNSSYNMILDFLS